MRRPNTYTPYAAGGSSPLRKFSQSFRALSPRVTLASEKFNKRAYKVFCIIERIGNASRRAPPLAVSYKKPSKRDSNIKSIARLYSIIMCSAFRLFTLERIASRLNTFHLPKATSHDKMVYGRMMYSLGYRPCALSVRLDGSSSAACPWGLSLKCKHIIACDCGIIYSKKNNKHFFADFTHLCNIYTINLRNGADELVQY